MGGLTDWGNGKPAAAEAGRAQVGRWDFLSDHSERIISNCHSAAGFDEIESTGG
jgi:hypothetical protein